MSDLYGRVFSSVLFPLWETTIRGRATLALARELERTQWHSPDELEVLRLGALRRLLAHAITHVPHYGARARAVGFDLSELRTTADLARLPLLTRAMAIDTRDARRSPVHPLPTIEKRTGGTTGQPLLFSYDSRSEDWRQAIKLRGWGWAGFRPGARALYYWMAAAPPPLLKRTKIRLDRWLKREHYIDCTRRDDAHHAAAVAAIRRERPEILICFTQAGAELARYIQEQGMRDWDDIPVLCCAEELFPADRAALTAAFGPAVFQTYGCRELMLLATECTAHSGMHVSAENVIVELVVRSGEGPSATERPARPGETGEVVLTDLHNYGMPFIRYLNGDLATAAADSGGAPCACGRQMPLLSSVDGRVTATLHDGGGTRLGGLVLHVAMTPYAERVRHFQAAQDASGAITFKFVPGVGFTVATRESIESQLRRLIPGVGIRMLPVDDIPLGRSGKRQIVLHENGPRSP